MADSTALAVQIGSQLAMPLVKALDVAVLDFALRSSSVQTCSAEDQLELSPAPLLATLSARQLAESSRSSWV